LTVSVTHIPWRGAFVSHPLYAGKVFGQIVLGWEIEMPCAIQILV